MNLIEKLRTSNLVFPALITLVFVCGAYLHGADEGALTKLIFTIFTLLVWVVGLCLHEFAHAYSAFHFGDKSVEEKGYLTLNPLLYGDFISSFLFPILILIIGGLPLPGGAVFLNHHSINGKFKIMLTYLCGPLANLAFAFVLFISFYLASNIVNNFVLISAIALAIYLQIYTAIFNLLPIPSFDGYGAISTWFSENLRAAIRPIERFAMWGLILAFLYAPQLFVGLQLAAILPMMTLGVDIELVDTGFGYFLGGGG